MWGFLINGIQSSALEWKEMTEVPWDGETRKRPSFVSKKLYLTSNLPLVGLLVAFTCGSEPSYLEDISGVSHKLPLAMIILYTVSPLLYRLASSAYYNLSLLSSDFYGLLFGSV